MGRYFRAGDTQFVSEIIEKGHADFGAGLGETEHGVTDDASFLAHRAARHRLVTTLRMSFSLALVFCRSYGAMQLRGPPCRARLARLSKFQHFLPAEASEISKQVKVTCSFRVNLRICDVFLRVPFQDNLYHLVRLIKYIIVRKQR